MIISFLITFFLNNPKVRREKLTKIYLLHVLLEMKKNIFFGNKTMLINNVCVIYDQN